MNKFIFTAILILVVTVSVATFSIIYVCNKQDVDNLAKIEIVSGPDNKVTISVTRQQLYRDIAPLTIEDFLAQTKIASLKGQGLKLIDINKNGIMARYGFKKGDIIKEIAGTDIDSLQEAIIVCDAIEKDIFTNKDEKDVDIKLAREGEDFDMKFKIPPFVPETVYYEMTLTKRGGQQNE